MLILPTYRPSHVAILLGAAMTGLFGCATESAPIEVTVIFLSKDSVTIEVGDTITLRARAGGPNGWVDDAAITWTSDRPSVASASRTGLVTGLSAGNATVTAHAGTISRSVHVAVRGPVARIEFDRDSLEVIPGWEASLTAVGVDQAGQTVATALVWESSDSSVARPPAGGSVLGGRAGRATLTARAGTASGTVPVVVRPRSGVLTIVIRDILYDLALDGSLAVRWPVQPTRTGFRFGTLDWSGTGRLVYSCGDTTLCLVAQSGATEVVAVPTDRANGPSWWPDNRRIVYGRRNGAQIIDPATGSTDAIELTSYPLSVRVSPNGADLAIVNLDDDYELSVHVKDARGIRKIPSGCTDADWSPDGAWLTAICSESVYQEHVGTPLASFGVSTEAYLVRWDPSGQLLAFLHYGGSLTLSHRDGTGQMLWQPSTHGLNAIQTFGWRRP